MANNRMDGAGDIDMEQEKIKSGFVAIIGAPNAGKSTLLNRVLGQKISITSRKPQTTRDRILGIVNRKESQIVFVDTPGIHRATTLLNQKIVAQAMAAIEDVDTVLMLIDVSSQKTADVKLILSQLEKISKPIVLALNKIDLIKKPAILPLIETYKKLHDFTAVVPVSAKTGLQIEPLLDEIEKTLEEGGRLFPEETLTDVSEKFIVGEIIREKIFRLTGMEIPYSSAVTVDSFEVEKKLIVIHASIHVTRNSQKGIIIGKQGSMLKTIGEKARLDIEKMVGSKVLLKLFVKVSKDWNSNERILTEFGY